MESGWNLLVWLVGVVAGGGWNLWVWLVGVVVRRYIDILIIIITFPYSTCISSFFGSSIPTSLFIFKMFFRSFYLWNNLHLEAVNCTTFLHLRKYYTLPLFCNVYTSITLGTHLY